MKEKLRIDKYLWCIRIFKTRSLAADAIDRGRVKLNGDTVKASRAVVINDEYDIRTESRRWIIRVKGLLDHRVQYTEAITYYDDLTPIEEKDKAAYQAFSFNTGKRQSKVGRPTKKQRRDLEDFTDEPGLHPEGTE
ncbi:RNA-binding S4 domain-containing protein [Flavihumibacter petaseus]|uniref:Putative RNA-binding protein n=1 Tax=Flavihumibacter petaseus NBRC 106054 TaxID=1220578 RepID=A0A0E9MVD7_9BACT|nr:RNA-binding S4 domain-containing protein [Flavihumibacter petaseus]GAO41544.1 putative RNA-binding protein [Flavihumibacter petaseus NBRC 106054]